MTQPIGRGGTITLDAFYTDGGGVAVDPVDPKVSIIDATSATLVDLANPAHVGLGHFQYAYDVPVDGALGAWEARWYGIINGVQAGPIDDGFTVLPAGSITFDSGAGGACNLWCVEDDVAGCGDCDGLDSDVVADAIAVATDVLYNLSGQRYPGVCSDRVRPENSALGICGDRYLRDAVIQGKITSWDYRGCGVHGFAGCGCSNYQQVRLGAQPIVAISEVKVNGLVLAADTYTVLDETWLVRTDGSTFPCCQDSRLPATELGTFEVAYTYGIAPPVAGVKAAAKLACEIAKACAGQECALPERVTTLTRQGVTMAVIDPHDFLDHGRTGIYLVDLFLKAHPAAGTTAAGASIQSPDYNHIVRRRV